MRIMMIYKPGLEDPAPPTPEHIEKMDRFIGELTESGSLLETGGLQHSSTGKRVSLTDGKFTLTDGPFTEAKEIIGGYAIVETRTMDEAVELAKRFLKVAGGGTSEIRPMSGGPPDMPAQM